MGKTRLFEGFLQDYERRDKRKTAETYRKLLSQFEKWLDDRGEAGEFTREDVLKFLEHQNSWANASKNVFLASLKSWAKTELEKVQPTTTDDEKREVRRLKQIKGIKAYDDDSEEKEPLDLEEIMDLRTTMDQKSKQVLWVLLWFGLRVGELDNIEKIDYETQRLTVIL